MSRTTARRRVLEPPAWTPPDGFVEGAAGVWVPRDYQPTEWELPAPEIKTAENAQREYCRCKRSLAWFALRHCWTLDLDNPQDETPVWRKFPAYPYFRQLFTEIQQPVNTHIEKSRRMLLSWALMITFLWDISFHENWSNLAITRKEKELDDGGSFSTYNSLLGKLRYVWLALPPYLQQPIEFKYLLAHHRDANSFVKGETGTKSSGRGPGVKRALLDEAAYIEHSEAIFGGVRQAAQRGTMLVSTPNGKGNVFARIRFLPETTFKKITIHWSAHPEKARGLFCSCGWASDSAQAVLPHEQFRSHDCANRFKTPPEPPQARSPWYDTQARDLTPEQVAADLDISYERSRRGRVFGTFDQVRHVREYLSLVGEQRRGETLNAYRERYLRAVLVPDRQPVVGWDFGVGPDPTWLVLGQVLDDAAMRIRWVDTFWGHGKSWDHYHGFVNGLWAPLVRDATRLDLRHFADPAGKQRGSDLMSWVTNLASREPKIVLVTSPRTGSVLAWLDLIDARIRDGEFEVMAWCVELIDALQNYRYPTDEEGQPLPGRQLPVHDKYSHPVDALRYVYAFKWPDRVADIDRRATSASRVLTSMVEDDERPSSRKIF